MIRDGDRVAVGVSGGKDSLVLLWLLAALRRFYPARFSLTAITLDPCFDGQPGDYSAVADLCRALDVPYIVEPTRLWKTVFADRQEANPCSLCARLRRGTLHRAALDAGCRTVALGHHRDDAAETLLMNLLTGGTLDCFAPRTFLDRRGLTLIRPMVFIPQEDVARFARQQRLPVVPSRCPVNGRTERARTGELLAQLRRDYGPVEQKILHAMQKNHLHGW
ncbi:MAG: tRNA 2-thiocytidine biosynthesis protein TtcA [Clostridia bacterium]|nr:tRNA 2-thiocytidine biosynthesis protein TtcA [Clostridia bacterium]